MKSSGSSNEFYWNLTIRYFLSISNLSLKITVTSANFVIFAIFIYSLGLYSVTSDSGTSSVSNAGITVFKSERTIFTGFFSVLYTTTPNTYIYKSAVTVFGEKHKVVSL